MSANTNSKEKSYKQLNKKLSIIDGVSSNIMTTLTLGVFLTGFALSLGLNNFQIGIMAALPAFASIFQIIGSYLVHKGNFKKICLYSVFAHRIIWILIAVLPLIILTGFIPADMISYIFLGGIALASIFAAISSVSWMSWISEIIPEDERGNFFGKRNMLMGIAAIIVGLFGGQFIDFWETTFPENLDLGFSLLIVIGIIFGFISLHKLSLMSYDSSKTKEMEDSTESFFRSLCRPFQDDNFRKFIYFGIGWGFAVGLSSPFFNIYMIETLGISFSRIALLGVFSGVTNAVGMQFWGNIADTIGTRTLLFITSLGASITPFLWLFTSPGNYFILWPIHLITGLVWSGIGLGTSLLLMQLIEKNYRAIYFAIFAASSGLAATVSPILGGYLAQIISRLQINMLLFNIEGLQFIFLFTGILRLLSLGILHQVDLSDQLPLKQIWENRKKYLIPVRNISPIGLLGMQSLENIYTAFNRNLINPHHLFKKLWD